MRGRPKESGYHTQLLLLEALGSGPMCFQEIINTTRLDRTIGRKNLKILVNRKLVYNYRVKHKSIYELTFSGFLPLMKYEGLFRAWLRRYDELHREEQESIGTMLDEQPYYLSDEFKDEFERLYQKHWAVLQEMYRGHPYWDKGLSEKERIHYVKKYKRIQRMRGTRFFTSSIKRRKKKSKSSRAR